MAQAGSVLNMVFLDAGEAKRTIKLAYADNECDGDDVNTLMGTIIANGSMFADTPVSKVSAQIVTTSVRDIILS